MDTVKLRLKQFLKTIPNAKGRIGMSEGEFEKLTGLSNSAISNIGNSLHPDSVKKIKAKYPQLNEIWLLHGQGEMILQGSYSSKTAIKNKKDIDIQMHTPDSQAYFDVPKKMERIESLIQQVLELNKVYAAAHKDLTEAHLKAIANNSQLTNIVNQSVSIVNEVQEYQKDDHTKIFALEQALVELGLKVGAYKTTEQGHGEIYKFFEGEPEVKKSAGTVDKLGKQNK